MAMHHIFVGNPGVGKSTLLNCLLGEHVFESGISIGSGKTYQMDIYRKGEDDSQVYLDTPGLEDDEKRKNAAQSITEALKQQGNYKVFFVVTLESGRARPIDKLVMKLVLECCEDIKNYTVIVNKLTKHLIKTLETNEEKRNKLFATLIPKIDKNKRTTKPDADIKFLERIDELEDCDNVRVKIDELNVIVDNALSMTIHKANVQAVDETGFDEKLREQEQKNEKLLKDKAKMDKMLEALKVSQMKIEAAREAERVRLENINKELMEKFNKQQERFKMLNQAKQEEPEWCYIRGVESSLYLDHSGGGKHGNRLELQNKSGHDCQLWKLTKDGYIENKLGHVMDVAKFGECGGRVDGWHANNTIKQKWYKEGQYIVSSMNHKVLEVERRRTDRGAGIIIYKKNGQPNQLWKWIPE